VWRDSADIAAHWPLFLRDHPDFTKVFLLNSEDFSQRANDSSYVFRRGVNPALVHEIVRRSHAAGLRVAAHIQRAGQWTDERARDTGGHSTGYCDGCARARRMELKKLLPAFD
jgi:hypothetical protein